MRSRFVTEYRLDSKGVVFIVVKVNPDDVAGLTIHIFKTNMKALTSYS